MPFATAQEYPVWVNGLIFLVAAGFVWLAGSRLTLYVDEIAGKRGLSQAFAGMLLMGVITSLPEIANSITSSLIGNPALAVNNLLGSAAINVLLLAIADAFIGRDALTSVVAGAGTLMQSTLCMIVLISVAVAILSGDVLVFQVGLWALGLCAISIFAFWLASRYGRRAPWTVTGDTGDHRQAEAGDGRQTSSERRDAGDGLFAPVLKTVVAGGVILVAGYSLSRTGDALAEQTGLGTGMVGFALIGLSTSLPELSSIISAIRIRRHEMAIGEILGTNFVNVSLILLVDAAYAGGPVINELGPFETISALLGAVLVGVYLIGLLERRDLVVLRMGYDSLSVIVLFAAGLALLYSLPSSPS